MDSKRLDEGLVYGEMKGLVDNIVSIDQYKPKIGKNRDTVVLAISVTYEQPATDLASFIETSPIELLDVDVSPVPITDGKYKVFIEFERNEKLYSLIAEVLSHIDRITSKDGNWQFIGYKLDEPRDFDEKRFNRDIVTNPDEYKRKFEKTEDDNIKERIEFLVKY